MFTRLAQYTLRLIGTSAVLAGAGAFVAPPVARALEHTDTTTQSIKLPTQAQLVTTKRPLPAVAEANLAANTTAASSSPTATGSGTAEPTPTAAAPSVAASTAVSTPRATVEATATPTATAKPAAPKPAPSPKLTKTIKHIVHAVDNGAKLAEVLSFARAQLGERYVMGGIGPNVWDCSGLTLEAFRAAGIDIGGHGVHFQYNLAADKGYLVPFADKKPGDLVFYGTAGDLYHVAIYSGDGKIIEAANPARPVIERPYWGVPYYQVARFIR